MYVAVTRARARLYLSFAQTRMLHGQTRYNIASRFLEEIPSGLQKWLTPKLKNAPAQNSPYGGPSRSAMPRNGAAASDSGLSIGQNVNHAKFGQGVIVNAEGSGTDARVQVNFSHAGLKWLALAVAKLTPV